MNQEDQGAFIGAAPNRSKFEEHGDRFINFLERELTARRTELYEYQIRAVLAMRDYFNGNEDARRDPGMIVAPTGSGKSGMVVMLPYVLRSSKVLVLSPSKNIRDQLAQSFGIGSNDVLKGSFFWKANVSRNEELRRIKPRGIVVKTFEDFQSSDENDIVIVNAQKFAGKAKNSLVNKDKVIVENVKLAFQSYDTLIVDEAHHYPATTWKNIVDQFNDKKVVFLTATPYRKGRTTEPEPILELNRPNVYIIPVHEVEGFTIRKCEFLELANPHPEDSNPLKNESTLIELKHKIFKILEEHDRQDPQVKHKAMVMVPRKGDAEFCATVLGGSHYTSDKSSESSLKDFETPDGVPLLVVCGRLLEGYDYKIQGGVSVCVILRNVGFRRLFSQFVGRCSRMRMAGDSPDTIKGCVISLSYFKQREMWDQHCEPLIPESDDPVEEEENDGEVEAVEMEME